LLKLAAAAADLTSAAAGQQLPSDLEYSLHLPAAAAAAASPAAAEAVVVPGALQLRMLEGWLQGMLGRQRCGGVCWQLQLLQRHLLLGWVLPLAAAAIAACRHKQFGKMFVSGMDTENQLTGRLYCTGYRLLRQNTGYRLLALETEHNNKSNSDCPDPTRSERANMAA
jgi:hypothetical protein